jgi:predicted enzyme related to lactoylglutathione lyase
MSERTSYLPGTPSWVDLGSPDTGVAAKFYGELFGWKADMSDDPNAGGYGIFLLRDKPVAGLGPQQNMDMPPYWTVYVTVANVDETLAASDAAGGTTVMEGMDIPDVGRMAVVQDPNGSYISLWQPMGMPGAAIVNETGSFGWNELASPDLAKSNAFYQAVFGWGLAEGSSDGASLYTVDGNMVCGAHTAGEGEPPFWSVWFTVDDCDAAAAKVTELGGSVVMPPNDMDFGRGGVVADPSGAAFGIAAVKPEMAAG